MTEQKQRQLVKWGKTHRGDKITYKKGKEITGKRGKQILLVYVWLNPRN